MAEPSYGGNLPAEQAGVGGAPPSFEGEFILVENDGHVATVTMNRPDRLNVFSIPVLHELSQAFDRIAVDGEVNAVVFRSTTHKVFSGGADIRSMAEHGPEEAEAFSRLGHSVALRLERSLPPTIMVCRGGVLGGALEFALACDMRVASDDAFFSQPEIDLGVIPGWGGTQRLIRVVGPTRAKEMIYSGRRVSATEALAMGLVNAVAPANDVDAAARELADIVASKGRLALMAAKRAMSAVWDTHLHQGIGVEVENWSILFDTEDQKEGMRAFLEKRKPGFRGR